MRLTVKVLAGAALLALAATGRMAMVMQGATVAAQQAEGGTIALNEAVPALGTYVTYAVAFTPTNLDQKEKGGVRIQTLCYQQPVPFDYTWPDGSVHTQTDALDYAQAHHYDEAELLGGSGSVWLYHGGAAHCVATLYYWSYKGGTQTFHPLATTEYDAAGQ